MFPRLARVLVLVAAVQILGGHWAVLQTVAWAQMIVEYSQTGSLSVAVAKTFNGANPCSLCETVAEGRQQEQQEAGKMLVVKLEAVLPPAVRVPQCPSSPVEFFPRLSLDRDHSGAPPTPPPRLS